MECFSCRIHQKLGIFDEIFPKNRKFCIISYKSKLKINIVGRKIRKIGFYGKTSTNFQSFSLQLIAQITNYCRKHRKFTKFVTLHNTKQNSEKFSCIVAKLGIFLKCHNNCSSNKHKLLTHKILKAAINCSHVYCEEDYGKVLQTRTSLFKEHYCGNWC